MVLERAAQTLAINRLAERDRRELSHQAQAGLLNALRQPRGLGEDEAQARAAALGLRRSPYYVPIVFRSGGAAYGASREATAAGDDPLAGQQEERALLEQLARALKSVSGSALTASIRSGSVGMILAIPAKQLEDPTLQRLADAFAGNETPPGPPFGGNRPGLAPEAAWSIGVGHMRGSFWRPQRALTRPGTRRRKRRRRCGVTGSRSTGPPTSASGGCWPCSARIPAPSSSRSRSWRAVLQAEARGGGGYLELLGQYLESGGNKAALARKGYLSRPTLYARLGRFEELLGVDLDDAESRTSLHVALLLHRLRGL